MIDQTSQFFAILTNIGLAKQANADALGIAWKITQMGVGDANGTEPMPSATQTALINERRRAPLNQLKVDPTNSAIIIAEQVIPEDVGGWWIREIGLYDADGDLVAIANCAPSFKPLLTQGSGRTQVVRMNMIVSNASNVELKIDPSVVLATRAYVDAKVLEEMNKLDSKQSVRVATTANIALAGLQTIDAVALVAGDRVLVKNQTVAKDNGIYVAAAAVWTRAPDADTNAEVTSALLTSVEQGATLADTRWQLVTDGLIVLGTTALTFQDVTQGYAPINSPAFLGAPTALTPPQFDSSLRLVNTAFAKRMGVEYSGFAPLIASTALGASSIGGMVSAASATPINITVPPTAGVPDGATVEVGNAGIGAVTVLSAGLDVLTTPVAGTITVVLGSGDNAEFVKVAGGWRLRGGSVALKYAAVMSGPNWVTPAQFASDKSLATTEFVKNKGIEFSRFLGVNSSQTLVASSAAGAYYFCSPAAPISLTLPLAATCGNAQTTFFNAGSANVTLVRQGADGFNNSFDGVVRPGTSISLAATAGSWNAVGGDALLSTSPLFASALAGPNCWQKLPGGDIEQWGLYTSAASGVDVVITLPVAMLAPPTNIELTFADHASGLTVGNSPVLQSRNATAGTITVRNLYAGAASFFWKVRGRV
ncbi:phage tail protein [Pseudomonas sp. C2B4]|nr:phage tail protein [Pseudomonas sp. C2B4]NUU37379.1 phage tail protein [Pseudomonas sp. C2B4]